VLQELEAEAEDLWPPFPERVADLESWLRRARGLAGKLPAHRSTLAGMRASGAPRGGEDEPVSATVEEEWQHDILVGLIRDLEELESGLLAEEEGPTEHGWSVPARLSFAHRLEEGFAEGGEYAAAWQRSLAPIRRAYPDLDLLPQMGLVPLGPDPRSGLWEFGHLMSGELPERAPDGDLVLTERTCIVLVLIPGGSFLMGAGENESPWSLEDERPAHTVTLAPFLLSKYEMTQGQWLRVTGVNPSSVGPHGSWTPAWSRQGGEASLRHPVEVVSWDDCSRLVRRIGLSLPTEAQWEYASRAGSETPWWSGADAESLNGVANIADAYARIHGEKHLQYEDAVDDGFVMHAPVGSFRANPFGLFDVHGNVWEWCLDDYGSYSLPVRPGDGRRLSSDPNLRVSRGGGFNRPAGHARSAVRLTDTKESKFVFVGLRPAARIRSGT